MSIGGRKFRADMNKFSFFSFSTKLKENFIWMMVKLMIIVRNINLFIVVLHLKTMNFNQRMFIIFYLFKFRIYLCVDLWILQLNLKLTLGLNELSFLVIQKIQIEWPLIQAISKLFQFIVIKNHLKHLLFDDLVHL